MANTNFKLKALRVMRDLTQEELAKELGIHEVTYNRKEQGLSQFTLNEAKQISDFFKESIEDIFFAQSVYKMET